MEGIYTLLGAVIAAVVALVGIRVRERRLDADRFTERKQGLYIDLWTVADRHRREVDAQADWLRESAKKIRKEVELRTSGPDEPEAPLPDLADAPTIGSSEPARLALKALELLAPEPVVNVAAELYKRTANMGAWFAWDGKGEPVVPPVAAYAEAARAWDEAADAFLDAARQDLRPR